MPLFAVHESTVALALGDTLLLTSGGAVVQCTLGADDGAAAAEAGAASAAAADEAGAEDEAAAGADVDTNIVAVVLSADGATAVTAHNSKTLCVWRVADGACVARRRMPKKPSSLLSARLPAAQAAVEPLAVTEVVLVGDKTGDVHALPLPQVDAVAAPALLLGHTASVITALVPSTDGTLLVSADRDEKVRVSPFPSAHCVTAYCLGLTSFVSSLAVMAPAGDGDDAGGGGDALFALTGDATLGAWQLRTGRLLQLVDVGPTDTADDGEADASADDAAPAPGTALALAACSRRRLVAIAREGAPALLVYRWCDDNTFGASPVTLPLPAPAEGAAFLRDGRLLVLLQAPHLLRVFAPADDAPTSFACEDDDASPLSRACASARAKAADEGLRTVPPLQLVDSVSNAAASVAQGSALRKHHVDNHATSWNDEARRQKRRKGSKAGKHGR